MQAAPSRNRASWILLTGLLTAVIDIGIVFIINYKVPPERICRYIASGAFGSSAFTGSIAIAWYGLLFHFLIAMAWTIVFFLLYPPLNRLVGSKLIQMIVTGIGIWLVMNLIVLPLANTSPHPIKAWGTIKEIVILIFAYGVPITLIAARFYKTQDVSAHE